VGWIKRGPSGVIGTNKKDAADTVARVTEDIAAGALNDPANPDPDATAEWLAERVPDAVSWEGWTAIDEHERRAGQPYGRPRVKLVKLADLVAAARARAGVR
jgi:ferredoxin--NADP+ reductase